MSAATSNGRAARRSTFLRKSYLASGNLLPTLQRGFSEWRNEADPRRKGLGPRGSVANRTPHEAFLSFAGPTKENEAQNV
jgi:hypothetical protein